MAWRPVIDRHRQNRCGPEHRRAARNRIATETARSPDRPPRHRFQA
ncbi:hypothetical protein C7S15_4485 [Burkholderia cepacia]|nr:hypothetical protein [Burkholderia cepacia]